MFKRISPGIIAISIVFQTMIPGNSFADVQLKEVVVTATKTEKSMQDVTQSMTVITAAEIQKAGAATVAEVIRSSSGAVVSEYGGLGANVAVSLRGAQYQQVLILLDGQRLNSASAGGFSLSDIPVQLDTIERIEIVRGPTSALYGADAVGGVVNIITKKPSEPVSTLGGAIGAHGYTKMSLSTAGKEQSTYYVLSAGKERAHGFRLNDDTDQRSAALKIGYDLDTNSSIEANTGYLTKDQGVPGPQSYPSPFARQQTRELISGVKYKQRFSQGLDMSLRTYENRETIGYQNPDPFFPEYGRHLTKSTGSELQMNWLISSFSVLTIGAEAREDHLDSSSTGNHSASLSASYIQDELNLGDSVILVLGGRNDRHSIYGSKWSPRASARVLDAESGTILRLSVGKSFRAPTLNDLYWPDSVYAVGNPNLKPETAEEYEGGIEQPFGNGNTIKGTYFRRRVKDLIEWQPDSMFKYMPTNIGRAEIKGVEAEARLVFSTRAAMTIQFSHLFPVNDTTGERIFSDVSHIPDRLVSGTFSFFFDAQTVLFLNGRWIKNYVRPEEEKWEFYTVDGKLTETIVNRKGFKADFYVGMKNMFNRTYETVRGYPMPRAEAYGGIALQF